MYDVANIVDMGRVISFWSPVHRQGAVSTTTAVMASYMADHIEDDNKILVMSNELYGSHTAVHYLVNESVPDGLTEVCELSSSDNLKSASDIYNNTFSTGSKIDILNSSKRNTNIKDFLPREIPNIFNVARKGYKYTLVDTVSGIYDEATQAILRNCDIIVICMPQDRYIFDSWIKKTKGFYTAEAEKKPTIIISECHYEYEHMKYASMQKQLKSDLYYISLNDLVHKAVSERDVPGMIHAQLKAKNKDEILSEAEAICTKIDESIEGIIEFEVKRALEEEEKSKQDTKEYLDNVEALFGDMTYGEETPEEESRISDESIEAFYGVSSSSTEDTEGETEPEYEASDSESEAEETPESGVSDEDMMAAFGIGDNLEEKED